MEKALSAMPPEKIHSRVRWIVRSLLLITALQLIFNAPFGVLLSIFTADEYLSRYISATFFYVICLFIYLCSSLILIIRRFRRGRDHFHLPCRGEILLHIGSVVLISFGFIGIMASGPSFLVDGPAADTSEHLRFAEYSSYLAAGVTSAMWASFIGIVFAGTKREQERHDTYLRGITFMSLED